MEERERLSIFVTILSFFAVLVLLTGTAITGANYIQTRNTALDVATTRLDAAVLHFSERRVAFFSPVNLFVELYSHDPRVTGEHGQIDSISSPLLNGLSHAPQILSVYVGYENGEFFQALSFSGRNKEVAVALGGPPTARFALRTIRTDKAGARVETFHFLDDNQKEIASLSKASPSYDPRTRGWYKDARARPGEVFRTAPYVFAATPQVGLTIDTSFDGPVGGVVASDVTLGSLSDFLQGVQQGPRHRVLVFDDTGSLIASPNPDDVIKRTGSGADLLLKPAKITDLDDPVIHAVARQFDETGAFDLKSLRIDGEEFLASVVRQKFVEPLKGDYFILYAAPRSDFEGTLASAASRSIIPGLLIILLASPGIVYLARRVARPLTDLANNAKLIEAILNTIPYPLFYKDPDSKYIGCNGAYESYFNLKRTDIVGKKLSDLNFMAEPDRSTHQAEHEDVIRTGGSRRREMTLSLVDGRTYQTLYQVSGFRRSDGSPGGLVATLVDISELKDAQEALSEAKEVAEAATKAKSDFLASMSHEIRTPMNGVTGMADLLAQTELNDEQKHMLRTIRESGNALITVINDILDFSKIEAGKLGLEELSMSIVDAVEGVAGTLTPNATAKGVRIHTFVDPEIPTAVRGDPVRLRQILFNLTGNAVKFSEKKDVALRATLMHRSDDGQCRVRFDVIDKGIGISQENQAKLFQAFSQAESSTTRRFGGTGLGLAICKRLVELMKGVIGVTSEPGKGSTFFAELPYAVAAEAQTREKPRDLGGLNILLVGSVSPRAETIETYLRHWGGTCIAVGDVQKGLETFAAALKSGQAFDSVILDFGLDHALQSEAVASFRDIAGGGKTPLILLQDFQKRRARIQNQDLVTLDANPLVRYRLLSAVAVAAGRASPEIKHDEEDLKITPTKAPTIDEARTKGQLILLAEDNLTNQDVIRRQLNLIGYTCEITNNGAEALKAWRSGNYAMLLTDCHMPEMDGYELTAPIRGAEQADRRLPIVAITANALQGEAERCLAAGMDDYLSKPIAMPALHAMLRKWMPAADTAPKAHEATNTPAASEPARAVVQDNASPVDDRVIKDMFGDDEATFREILGDFIDPSEAIVREIIAARQAHDADAVKGAAHKLKSSARAVGAHALADTCAALEAAGKAADWQTIDQLGPQSEIQMKQVRNYIEAI